MKREEKIVKSVLWFIAKVIFPIFWVVIGYFAGIGVTHTLQ